MSTNPPPDGQNEPEASEHGELVAPGEPVVPLNYARPDVPEPDFLAPLVRKLGGWRQIGFAVGLSLVVVSICAIIREDGIAFWGWLGGLMIGLCVRVPAWREE